MIQRARASGAFVFPPRLMVPGAGEGDLEWVEASGRGRIHSFTIVPQRTPQVDYNICLIDLIEGPRVLSRLVGIAHDDLAIGLAVEAVVDGGGDAPILLFKPAETQQ
jgi:uncharacterized OB-fold protein